MKETITIEEFKSDLLHLDWYYMMSDDNTAYERGRTQLNVYREMAEANGPEWVQLFDETKAKNSL